MTLADSDTAMGPWRPNDGRELGRKTASVYDLQTICPVYLPGTSPESTLPPFVFGQQQRDHEGFQGPPRQNTDLRFASES